MTISPSKADKYSDDSDSSPRNASPRAQGYKPMKSEDGSRAAPIIVTTGNNNMWRFFEEDSPGFKV
jgi:hypothetical protein